MVYTFFNHGQENKGRNEDEYWKNDYNNATKIAAATNCDGT